MESRPDLVDVATSAGAQLRKHGKELTGPCPICGTGDNRFNIMANREFWLCRICSPKPSRVFDLLAKLNNTTWEEEKTKWESGTGPNVRARQVTKKAPTTVKAWDSEAFQVKATTIVVNGSKRLPGSEGERFLLQRGISMRTAAAYKLGFIANHPVAYESKNGQLVPSVVRDVVVIPWIINRDGKEMITAVKFRNTNPQASKNERFTCVSGSLHTVFGSQTAQNREHVLIVEGEFNAISIYESASDIVDVFSIGGDCNIQSLDHMVTNLPNPVVWLDNPQKIEQYQRQIKRQVKYIHSPRGLDANDILVKLGAEGLREFVCRTVGAVAIF